ncbi:protein kinase domain-containing protein [Nocardia australiensis]|uniref:protein kinase domain-containing protein n=1 Tax=Nocardia australiensis TaxID=2887191 RepID=UPI001D1410DF|nr:protein kinase [Nocardia australiensis]
MADADPPATQADLAGFDPNEAVAAELSAAGFEDSHEVGRGGFGVVLRCRQGALGRTVAVKVLSASLDRENRERFLREEYAMGTLSGHPNIVAVYEVGVTASGRPFIVMPFCGAGSLEARIHRQGPLTWSEALHVGVKLAGALETAHGAGILHRDVKPANVLLTDYGEPQLTDFGIARTTGGFETTARAVTGTLAFTAPEVLEGGPPSVESDVYALGATLFCLVSGHAAFERRKGEEAVAQFVRIAANHIPDLRQRGVPGIACELIETAMARNPVERPHTAAEFGNLVREVELRSGLPIDEMALPGATGSGDTSAPRPARERSPSGWAARTGADLPDRTGRGAYTTRPPRLPLQLTSFVGRRAALADVGALLTTARLVTLTGPGGVGKSRLAVEAAAASPLRANTWLVDLGTVLEPELLVDKIVDDLRLGDKPTGARNPIRALVDRLSDAWGDRDALIVLDSCEHLVESCGPLVEELLRSIGGLRVLVTSQRVLGVNGEHVYPVMPLSLPDPAAGEEEGAESEAIALFTERARAAEPDFALTDDNRVAVARLCEQLDGMPLAIELAAARLRAYGLDEMLAMLADRFRMFATAGRPADPRHGSLQALVEWSYDLLTAQERDVWAMMSVFTGRFTAAAAAEVCAGPGYQEQDVRLILASLVDKSMLLSGTVSGVRRYRLLVTLRDFGRERLAETDLRQACLQRFVARYRRLAAEFRRGWFGPGQQAVYDAVHDERENFRAALSYSRSDGQLSLAGIEIVTSLHFYWLASCSLSEARRWLSAALESTSMDEANRSRAQWSSSVVVMLQGDRTTALDLATRARELAIARGDHGDQGYAAAALGFAAICGGERELARVHYQEAVQCQRDSGDAEGLAVAIAGLLNSLPEGDDTHGAQLLREAEALCTSAGDKWTLAYLTFARGYDAFRAGDLSGALDLLRGCLRLARGFGDRILCAWVFEVTSWIAVQRGDAELAARMQGAAAASWASGETSMLGYGGMREGHDKTSARISAALGESSSDRLLRWGGRTTLQESISVVLGERD